MFDRIIYRFGFNKQLDLFWLKVDHILHRLYTEIIMKYLNEFRGIASRFCDKSELIKLG